MAVAPPQATRDRILDVALRLMNRSGESGVSTAAIADSVGISQGNLHYHFRTKATIVDALLMRFERAMAELLDDGIPARVSVDDAWLFLQLLVETVERHRFLVRDLEPLGAQHPRLTGRVRSLLGRQAATLIRLCAALASPSDADTEDWILDAVGRAMADLVANPLSCDRGTDAPAAHPGASIAARAARALAPVAPLLDPAGRARLREISPGDRTPLPARRNR